MDDLKQKGSLLRLYCFIYSHYMVVTERMLLFMFLDLALFCDNLSYFFWLKIRHTIEYQKIRDLTFVTV